jgi:hypothetical protein
MISRDTYLKLREITRRYNAARKQFDPKRWERGGGYDARDQRAIAAIAGTRDTTNEEKAQIEEYEWRMFPPSRYFAYYDKDLTKITGFMGNVLGRIVWKGKTYRDTFGGQRMNIVVRGTNNVMYAGFCNMSSGTYCRLKRIKGKPYGPGVLPNHKKSRNPVRTAKHFMVVAVSGNTNSFGLYGMVLMTRSGEAWEVGASKHVLKKKGDLVRVPCTKRGEPEWALKGFEIPRRLPKPPAKVIAEVWG